MHCVVPAASVTISKVTHSGRINIIPSIDSGNDEYLIPIPTTIGESYRFIWGGTAADVDNIIFRAPTADDFTFTGGILSSDENEAGAADSIMVFPGADDEKLTLTAVTGFDLTFVATTLTNYCVVGWGSGDTVAAFGDIA